MDTDDNKDKEPEKETNEPTAPDEREEKEDEEKTPEDPTVSLRSDLDALTAVVNKINTRLESMEKALNDRLDGPNPPAEDDRSNESGSERDVDDLFDPAVQNDDF